jgi:hypothetical protein
LGGGKKRLLGGFSKSFCPSPPVAAEGGFEGGRRALKLKTKIEELIFNG